MEKGSTLVLRGAVLTIGSIILGICIFGLPSVIADPTVEAYRVIAAGLYVPAIPFFAALYQAMLLLHYIDTNKAFSELSVKALSYIKYCAIIISLMFAAGMPYVRTIPESYDPPVGLLFGLIIAASVVIATFAALLQQLLQNAIDIKAENDLTV